MNNTNYIPSNCPSQMMRNSEYIPVASMGELSRSKSEVTNDSINNVKKLSWWEPNSFFNYPSMLVSAYYGIKYKNNFRKHFNIPDDMLIIGDSGGFQNLTLNANLDPIEVLRWQEQNCQIGFIFDIPISFCKTKKEIKECQIKTVENAYIALKKRVNNKLKLYCVFHGKNPKNLKEHIDIYNEHGNINDFDGFALGSMVAFKSNYNYVTKQLVTICEINKEYKKPIHILGLSGLKIIPIIYYLSKKYNQIITYDSSSYGCGAIRKEYWLDYGRFSIEFSDKNQTTINKLPCDCPICSLCTPETLKESGSISGGLISLHNLHQTMSYCNLIDILIEDENLFFSYLKQHVGLNIYDIISKIKKMFDENDFRIDKYFSSDNEINNTTQSNIFGF